jgi:hypothetical protein
VGSNGLGAPTRIGWAGPILRLKEQDARVREQPLPWRLVEKYWAVGQSAAAVDILTVDLVGSGVAQHVAGDLSCDDRGRSRVKKRTR